MNEYIERLINSVPKLNYVDIKTVLTDLYETEFSIFDHINNKSRPLASVAMLDCKDFTTDSLLEDIVTKYINSGVLSLLGIPLLEFLELPSDIVDRLFDLCNVKTAEKAKLASEVEKSLKK